METDNPSDLGGESAGRPGTAQARATLDALQTDGNRLASRVVSPWWYHVGLGVIAAALVGSPALPGPASITVIALGVIILPVLTVTYSRRYGVVTTQPAGPRSRRLLLLILAVLALAMVSSLVIKLATLSPWWAILSVFVAFTATVLLGRRYDHALRSEIAQGPRGPG